MAKDLTVERQKMKFQEINFREPEKLMPEDAASLKAAEDMDDGSVISLDELRNSLEGYSGKILLRIPRSLHKTLKEEADIEGVSLNQYMLFKLAK